MLYSLEKLFGIQDEVIAVTGGAGGIGRELCRSFVALGACVGLVAHSQARCEQAVQEIKAEFPDARILGVAADVTDEGAVSSAIDRIYTHFGKLDGLVNCAGINVIDRFSELSPETFNRIMAVNFEGTVNACRAAGRYMLVARKGRIVNISSLSAIQGKSYYAAYSASKAAINGFTRALAVEWAKSGINVNAICPGVIVTDINRSQFEENPEGYQKRLAGIPRGVPGSTEGMVGPVVALLSPGSAHLTGQSIYVDGGASTGDTFVLEEQRFALPPHDAVTDPIRR